MAELPWVPVAQTLDGVVLTSGPLGSGDNTAALPNNEGNAEVTLQIYGTIGGATVSVKTSLRAVQYTTIDDVYGIPMVYTSFGVDGVKKSVGPAFNQLKVFVSGGAGTSVTADAYIAKKGK